MALLTYLGLVGKFKSAIEKDTELHTKHNIDRIDLYSWFKHWTAFLSFQTIYSVLNETIISQLFTGEKEDKIRYTILRKVRRWWAWFLSGVLSQEDMMAIHLIAFLKHHKIYNTFSYNLTTVPPDPCVLFPKYETIKNLIKEVTRPYDLIERAFYWRGSWVPNIHPDNLNALEEFWRRYNDAWMDYCSKVLIFHLIKKINRVFMSTPS